MALLQCSTCGEIENDECTDIVLTDAGLSPNTTYWAIFQDPWENIYRDQFTTDGDGTLTILVANFPDGLFLSSVGAFTLYVSTSKRIRDAVSLTIETSYITTEDFICLSVQFVDATTGGGEPGEIESAFRVETSEVDQNPLLNIVHDEELIVKANNNDTVDVDAEPMHSRLLQMGAKGRFPIGLSDAHEHVYVAGANGNGINGTRFNCGEPCDGSQPAYDADAILKGYGCIDYGPDSFGKTLEMAMEEGSEVVIVHNARTNDYDNTLVGINEYLTRLAAEGRTDPDVVVQFGCEHANPNLYCDPNSAIYATVEDYKTAMQVAYANLKATVPGLRPVMDTPGVNKTVSWATDWNTGLASLTLDGNPTIYASVNIKTEDLKLNLDGSDGYNPDADFDAEQWKDAMVYGATVTMPAILQRFKEVFPTFGCFIRSFGQSGGPDKLNDYGTINAMLGHAMMCRQLLLEHLADPDFILGAAHYKAGSMQLTKTVPRFDWFVHCQFARLFQFSSAKICEVDTDISDVYGVGVKSASMYVIMLINVGGADVEIPNMNMDGSLKSSFSGTQYGGASLSSQEIITSPFEGVLKARNVLILNANV